MAAVANGVIDREPPRKRLKFTDLPLPASKRTTINGILHAYKKRGSFDTLRKAVWSSFEAADAKNVLASDITTLAENEIERNATLLAKDRRLAAPLIEGAAERSGVYSKVEGEVENLIEGLLGDAGTELRGLRRKDVGDTLADEEEKRGSKPDEDYAAHGRARRQEREKARQVELRKARQKEFEMLKKREAELLKQREERERLVKQKEEEKQKLAEQQRLRREAEAKERAERKARQDAQWAEEQRIREERAQREREKNMKEAALEQLLWEGKQAAAKSAGTVASPMRSSFSTKKESALDEIMRREKMERGEPVAALERVDSTTSRRLIKRRTDSDARPSSSTPVQPAAATSPTPAPPTEPKNDRRAPPAPLDAVPPRRPSVDRHDVRRRSDRFEEDRPPFSRPIDDARGHERPPPRHRQDSPPPSSREVRRSFDYPSGPSRQRLDERERGQYDRRRSAGENHDRVRHHHDGYDRERGPSRDGSFAPPTHPRGSRDDSRAPPTHARSRHEDAPPPLGLSRSSHEESHPPPTHARSRREESRAPSAQARSQRDSSPAGSRNDKNNTPASIDRYVPSTSARAARPNDSMRTRIIDRAAEDEIKGSRRRSRSRERMRSRSRDRDRDRRRRRSYSRSRSPDRERDRDRDRERRHRDRDRSRDRDRERRRRDRSRSRDERRRRSRTRSRSRTRR